MSSKHHHDFVIGGVLGVLDSMLVDNLQSVLFPVEEELPPEEKSQLYTEARRPVDALI
jgi:hypothetical protein